MVNGRLTTNKENVSRTCACVHTHATHTALAAVSPLSGHKEPVRGPGSHSVVQT